MTQEELQSIHQKAKERIEHAKQYGIDLKFPGDPWENDSLAKVVNTPEKAERFMRELRWTMEKANKK
ncbi:MAG TPA: hypothetical protein VHC48_01720 [Puia sp.]|jgi:hypothetical protein|nr:hypothetical protein [Puia sp.]